MCILKQIIIMNVYLKWYGIGILVVIMIPLIGMINTVGVRSIQYADFFDEHVPVKMLGVMEQISGDIGYSVIPNRVIILGKNFNKIPIVSLIRSIAKKTKVEEAFVMSLASTLRTVEFFSRKLDLLSIDTKKIIIAFKDLNTLFFWNNEEEEIQKRVKLEKLISFLMDVQSKKNIYSMITVDDINNIPEIKLSFPWKINLGCSDSIKKNKELHEEVKKHHYCYTNDAQDVLYRILEHMKQYRKSWINGCYISVPYLEF